MYIMIIINIIIIIIFIIIIILIIIYIYIYIYITYHSTAGPLRRRWPRRAGWPRSRGRRRAGPERSYHIVCAMYDVRCTILWFCFDMLHYNLSCFNVMNSRRGGPRRGSWPRGCTAPACLGRHYLSHATCLKTASFVLRVLRSVNDHHNLPHYSPRLKKPCVRQVVLDKWLPLIAVLPGPLVDVRARGVTWI